MYWLRSAFNQVNDWAPRLYNLTADPNEHNNLAQDMPEMVEMLSLRLEPYFDSMIPPHVAAQVEEGNPNLNEKEPGFWSTGWCTAQPETTCKTSESCVFWKILTF